MSPASHGALEVERYIGSCLISSTGRAALQKPIGGCRRQEQQGGIRTSKQLREQQCQNQFGAVGTWAGGAPLISMASNSRRNNQRPTVGQQAQQQNQQQQQLLQEINHQTINEQQLPAHLNNRLPLSRLAVHTQGAPLILSGRFHNNRAKLQNGQSLNAMTNSVSVLLNGCGSPNNGNNISSVTANNARSHPSPRLKKLVMLDPKKQQQQSAIAKSADAAIGASPAKDATATGANVANIDSLSIASDESSGSNNSENSLPRIIKPRKRRKKDRKPPVLSVVNSTNTSSTSDVKILDELQAAPILISANSSPSLAIVSTAASLDPQQQTQHHKAYPNNPYDGTRYPGENYYKGHRRPMNNGRDNSYVRMHSINNSTTNSANNSCPVNAISANAIPTNSQQEASDTRQQTRNGSYAYRHVQVKVVDDNRNVILPVPVCQVKTSANYLRHNHGHISSNNSINNNGSVISSAQFLHDCNEPVTLSCHQEASVNIDDCIQGSMCQCRYTDPSTFIWDVTDQKSYSRKYMSQSSPPEFLGAHQHHHHHHHHRYSQVPGTVFLTTTRPFICQEQANAIEFYDVTENPCLRLRTSLIANKSDGTAILRRSWSDPTSYFSEEIVPNRDVGVIGDRGQLGDSQKGRSSWRGDASTAAVDLPVNQTTRQGSGSESGAGSPGIQGPLEVSTEIVTSPNGHRDLEIKFYSSSPTSYTAHQDKIKSTFPFPDDDTTNDSEDISAIWSYHELKLQQDFRTLLQAEE